MCKSRSPERRKLKAKRSGGEGDKAKFITLFQGGVVYEKIFCYFGFVS